MCMLFTVPFKIEIILSTDAVIWYVFSPCFLCVCAPLCRCRAPILLIYSQLITDKLSNTYEWIDKLFSVTLTQSNDIYCKVIDAHSQKVCETRVYIRFFVKYYCRVVITLFLKLIETKREEISIRSLCSSKKSIKLNQWLICHLHTNCFMYHILSQTFTVTAANAKATGPNPAH